MPGFFFIAGYIFLTLRVSYYKSVLIAIFVKPGINILTVILNTAASLTVVKIEVKSKTCLMLAVIGRRYPFFSLFPSHSCYLVIKQTLLSLCTSVAAGYHKIGITVMLIEILKHFVKIRYPFLVKRNAVIRKCTIHLPGLYQRLDIFAVRIALVLFIYKYQITGVYLIIGNCSFCFGKKRLLCS